MLNDNNPWSDPRAYEPEVGADYRRHLLPGFLAAIGDYLDDGKILFGFVGGCMFTVSAAWIWSFFL